MEIQVSLGGASGVSEALLAAAVTTVLRDADLGTGEISLTLMDDRGIRGLNRDYLGRDRPTDVIAFALHDPGRPPLGDVYVGHEQAARQAAEVGVPLEEELVRLAIHGTLHVLGHDHPDGESRLASEMFALQERLVRELLD